MDFDNDNAATLSPLATVALFAVLVVISGAYFYFNRPVDGMATVVGYKWEERVQIEEWAEVDGMSLGWGSYPVFATEPYRDEATYTRSLNQLERDQGNCESTASEGSGPPYRCEVMRYKRLGWRVLGTQRATGNDHTPVRPVADYTPCDDEVDPTVGCQRVRDAGADYILVFQNPEGKQYECEVPRDVWDKTSIEVNYRVQYNAITDLLMCESINY